MIARNKSKALKIIKDYDLSLHFPEESIKIKSKSLRNLI